MEDKGGKKILNTDRVSAETLGTRRKEREKGLQGSEPKKGMGEVALLLGTYRGRGG